MRKLFCTFVWCWLALALVGIAQADVIFITKNKPQPNEQNITFDSSQIGTTITGYSKQTVHEYDFSSETNLLKVVAHGQAQIFDADGGSLYDIFVTSPDLYFHDFIVDLNDAKGSIFNVTVATNDGIFPFQFTGKNGSNFLTIIATNGESIQWIDFQSDQGWKVFKQPRVSETAPGNTPEPSSLLLLGSGVLGLGGLIRRFRM